MQEQETVDVMAQEAIVETRKEWQAPNLRCARINHNTKNAFVGGTDADELLS